MTILLCYISICAKLEWRNNNLPLSWSVVSKCANNFCNVTVMLFFKSCVCVTDVMYDLLIERKLMWRNFRGNFYVDLPHFNYD